MNARTLSNKLVALILLLISNSLTSLAAWAETQTVDTAKIEQLTGLEGKLNDKEGVFKVAVPRSDLKVTVAGVHMSPPMGLTSWAAFTKDGEQTLVMGDMVLLEEQVNPAMSMALDQGLEVTALHNHFFWDSPKVMFMHIGGRGSEEKLAAAVGKIFAKIKETSEGKGQAPHTEIEPAKTSLGPKKIEGILGVQGEMTDGVYKLTWGRTTKMGEHAIGNTMGVNTWAAFVGSDAQAVVDGDFAMYEDELQAVLKALRASGIHIVAIHSHMSMESPKVVFLHYWGIGSTTDLAKALKSALDTQRRGP
ncbi:MAG: DUF1259 domain-containing protein [Pseudomonadota bacterium]|nr:DUF1259 domain-containing protein [Pseudomonadota bacterium]